jgi:N-acetylmuramoyl-L-alanine amidase
MMLVKTILTGIIVLLATSAGAQGAAQQGATSGTVYQTSNVRSGPDTRFEIVGQLSEGDEVVVDGRDAQSRWLHVVLPTGEGGWLPVFALILEGDVNDVPVFVEAEATEAPSGGDGVIVISYGRVNVRSGPGIGYDIVGQLDVSQSAEAIARDSERNNWLMIQLGETDGWVAYFTVNVQGDTETLPVLVPDSSGDSLIPPSRVLRARFNVRLHTEATLASPVTMIVPFDSEVTVIGRNEAGDWLFVGFGEATGWGVTQLFAIARDEVETLPIHSGTSSGSTATPMPTPSAEATAES